jgi:hypothetical protein
MRLHAARVTGPCLHTHRAYGHAQTSGALAPQGIRTSFPGRRSDTAHAPRRPPELHVASSAAPAAGAARAASRPFGVPAAEAPAPAPIEPAKAGAGAGGGAAAAAVRGAEQGGAALGAGLSVGSGLVTTRLPLPAAAWADAALEAEPDWPPRVRAGEPFALRLRLRNRTPLLLDVALRAGDATGFVFAGARPPLCLLPST